MKRRIVAASPVALALSTGPGAALADDPPPTNPTTPIEDPIPGQIRQGPLRTQLQIKASGSGLTAPLYGTYDLGGSRDVWLSDVGQNNLEEVDHLAENDGTGPLSGNTVMLGFGEDARGNIWALANETGIPFEETGLVMWLVRRCSDKDFVNGDPDRQTPPCRD